MRTFAVVALAATQVFSQDQFNYRDEYGSLFSDLGDLDWQTDPVNPEGGAHVHFNGQSVVHVDLALACIDETEEMKTRISELNTKCVTTKNEADSLAGDITSLNTQIGNIKSAISTNAESIASLKANNAFQDSRIATYTSNIDALEARMTAFEHEVAVFDKYLESIEGLYSELDSDMDDVEDDQTDLSSDNLLYDIGELLEDVQDLKEDVAIVEQLVTDFNTQKAQLLQEITDLENGQVATQTAQITQLLADFTTLGNEAKGQKIMYDFWDNNSGDLTFDDGTDGLEDIVSFCIEAERMFEFHLAATLSDGSVDDHILDIRLVLDDVRGTILAKSSIVYDNTPRGRTYSLYYKGYTYTGDQDYKVQANVVYGGNGADGTEILIPDKNLQYAVRIFNEGYVLENDQPNTTCIST